MEQYEALILAQGNKCAICGVHQDELNKLLSIDHCHKTKKVRGLLCCKCNFGIGYFKEDVGIMEKAIKYVIQNT